MGEALLATSGDTIKLWDATSYAFCQEIPSQSGSVNRLAWNQDGQCLASLADSGKEISLSAICGKSEANIGVIRGIEAPSCLSFACRFPHYLGVGSSSGTITIWNVKSQAKKKVFAPTDRPINRIAFSHNDSHIAAATKKGTLYMLSVTNNLTAGPFTLFSNQVVTDLTYSRTKKSLLGCCSEGGSVALYDTHANKVIHSFPSAHSSPVAAVSFSPVNELLMVSVGYDKKLSCFNVQTKQPIMTHRSTAPLTSITFLGMGQLVALGTMTGQVLVHDMRTIRTPLATLKAHKTAVTNVLLQPSPKSKSVSSSKTSSHRNNTATTLTVPPNRPSKSCSGQPTEMSPEMRANQEAAPPPQPSTDLDLSVFSPIRNTNPPPPGQDQTCEATSSDNLQYFKIDPVGESVFSPVRTTDLHPPTHYAALSHPLVDINEGNLLSPVRDTNLTVRNDSINSESPASPWKPPSAMEITVSPAADITDKENIEPLVSISKEQTLLPQTTQQSTFTSMITESSQKDETPATSSFPVDAIMNSPGTTHRGTMPQDHLVSPMVLPPTRCEGAKLPDTTHRLPLPPSNNSSMVEEESKAIGSSTYSQVPMVTSPAPFTTMSFTSLSRLSPPKKRQLLRPVQASDLAPSTPPPAQHEATAMSDVAPAAAPGGAPQLQMELVRSCMVDVLEEFQDEINSRLMHLQYIITKKFIQQEEVMTQLHRQHSLNDDLMKENEKLRQQVAHLQAKY